MLGLCECLLGTPVRRTYTTTSLTHLVFFDKVSQSVRRPSLHTRGDGAACSDCALYVCGMCDQAAMLSAAARSPALLRSLWWYVAAHELRRMEGFQVSGQGGRQAGSCEAQATTRIDGPVARAA